jgi:ribosomal protein S18 acetylase RimI-like enzyme
MSDKSLLDFTMRISYVGARCGFYTDGYITSLICIPTLRKKGYATKLMLLLCELADVSGLTLTLDVGRFDYGDCLSNEELIKFYKKFGFKFVRNKRSHRYGAQGTRLQRLPVMRLT